MLENDSPVVQLRSEIVTAIAVLVFLFANKCAALDGLELSIPVVVNERPTHIKHAAYCR